MIIYIQAHDHVRRELKNHARRAGIRFNAKFSIHTFRKTCAQNWADYLPPNVVKFYLGHSDMNTTNRFYSVVDESHTTRTKQVMDNLLNSKDENHLDTGWTLEPKSKQKSKAKKVDTKAESSVNPPHKSTSDKSKNRGDRIRTYGLLLPKQSQQNAVIT